MTQSAHCLVDNQEYLVDQGEPIWSLRDRVRNRIKRDYPKSKTSDFICFEHLLPYQIESIQAMMNIDEKQIDKINRKLTKTLNNDEYEVTDVNDSLQNSLTFGQKMADEVARVAGSWGFIIFYLITLFGWMGVNVLHIFGIKFDPYPFILLNLFLSCIAALQAPIIMMSQNRAADRDRMNAENDYHINLKTEQELRILHAKIDHLMQQQMKHNIEVQAMIFEILSEMRLTAKPKDS